MRGICPASRGKCRQERPSVGGDRRALMLFTRDEVQVEYGVREVGRD